MCDTTPESMAHQAVCRLLFIFIAFLYNAKKTKALGLSLKLAVISHNFRARKNDQHSLRRGPTGPSSLAPATQDKMRSFIIIKW